MAHQANAHRDDSQYPEVVPASHNGFNVYNSSYEYFLPQDSPAPEYVPPPQARSPAPEYSSYRESRQLSSPSPRLSANSPPPLTTSFGHSPSSSDAGWKVRTPPLQYSEFSSPQPETVPQVTEKEYYNKNGTIAGVANANPLSYQHTVSRKPLPQALSTPVPAVEEQPAKKKPWYKRPLILLAIGAVIAIIVIAVALGVVFGAKKKSSSSDNNGSSGPSPGPNNGSVVITGDPDLAVGGYLSPTYFSKSGAFNGSGIAIAGANPGVDQTSYVFYQNYEGDIVYKLMKTDGTFSQVLGTVNDNNNNPMNGTPISIVNTGSANKTIVYHLFYLNSDYLVVERLLQAATAASTGSVIPVWVDGPLTSNKVKAMQADTIGMQACLWSNYDGNYTTSATMATDGIQFWVATDETTFTQYSWTNGTTKWNMDQTWTGMDAHAGVGCQTWESWATEYIFFVDQNQDIAMYWRDNNRSAPSTTAHPTLKWNKISNISIPSVQKSSSLGYTTYMIYQHTDTSIRGVNISWAAENTSIATVASTGAEDLFIINDLTTNNATEAVRGTHMSITALKTATGGAELQVFFQQLGNDIAQYTRDMFQVGGVWQKAASAV